ncbi:MAG: carboxypeptidase-like regulatory domain-containing protein [Desulfitobacterium sp.]
MLLNRFKKNKLMVVLALTIMMLFSFGQGAVFAADSASEEVKGEKPFPSPAPATRSLLALQNGTIGNDNVQAKIGSDGRFNAGLKELGRDNWFNMIYAWPSDPWSSFTSLKVDGIDKVFGNTNDGQFVQIPRNMNDFTNEAIWKTGDVSVKQVVQAGLNPATGIDDAIQIKYVLTNTGANNHEVGLRIMFDTMVNGNDSAPFRVPSETGMESINYEKDYLGDQVPAFWQVFQTFDNPDISAQYTMRGRNATPPDRFSIARWGNIDNTMWDYNINPGSYTGDSAVGMWWNPVTIAPGETKTIITYYGRPGVGGNDTLVLSGRQRIPYEEWSTTPFNIIAYLHNNTGSMLNGTRLEIIPGPGINLVNHDASHAIGQVMIGDTTQTTWSIQPNQAGIHNLTVNAYQEGNPIPFATAQYGIEALEPVVPPNISLVGNSGIANDGTPIAGRLGPLTINAEFANPPALGVTLIATDANGDRYEQQMTSADGVHWTHKFTPSSVGLWESPMSIQMIPLYAGGNGAPLTFNVILIDPSGYVFNATQGEGWRLPDATVRLQYFDPALQAWVNMSEDAYSGRMSPINNPQLTGEDGRYAWDVAAGQYRVVVNRVGFDSMTSNPVDVPPEVTDLNIGLTPNDLIAPSISYSGVAGGQTYVDPVSLQVSATDATSGLRSLAYSINGAPEVKADGGAATVDFAAVGAYVVNFSAVDYAGNSVTESVSFNINAGAQTGFKINVPGLAGIRAELLNPQTNAVVASSDWGSESVMIKDVTGLFKIRVTHNNPAFNVPISYTTPVPVNVTNGGEYTINPVNIVVPPFKNAPGIPAEVAAEVMFNNQVINAPITVSTTTGGAIKVLPLNSGKYQVQLKYRAENSNANIIFTEGTNTSGNAVYTVKAPGLFQIKAELLNPESNAVVAASAWGNGSATVTSLPGDYILKVTRKHPGFDNPVAFTVPGVVSVKNGGSATILPILVKIPALVITPETPKTFYGQVFYNDMSADVKQLFLPFVGGSFKELPLNDDQYEVRLTYDPIIR